MQLDDWVILVVEDEDDSAQVVSQVLEYHGATVLHSYNGNECLEVLRDTSPALIVMDLSMPELDGWQTLAAIREDAATAHLPVVAITAFDSPSVHKEAERAGFDAYFAKPLQVDDFISTIGSLMS